MVSGGCHFLSCNAGKRFGEVQEVLLCVLFVSFAPEVQRRATSAGYAHLYRQIQSGKRFEANEWHVLLASQGGGFCWVDLSFKFCKKALPLYLSSNSDYSILF